MNFNTPARLQRQLEIDEDHIDDLPSLPAAPSLDFSSEDIDFDGSSAVITSLRDAFNRTPRMPSRASHSTPPPLTNSSTSRSGRSTSSTERFAVSLQHSRASSVGKDRKQTEASFDVSRIEHASHELPDLSAFILDEESGLGAPAFSIPVHPEEDDGPLSDAMESVSLSSSSKKTDEQKEEPIVRIHLQWLNI